MFSNFSSTEEFFSKDYWRESPVLIFWKHFVFWNCSEKQFFTPTCTSILKYWVSAPWVTFPLPCYHKHQFLPLKFMSISTYSSSHTVWMLQLMFEFISICLHANSWMIFVWRHIYQLSMRSSGKLLISLA